MSYTIDQFGPSDLLTTAKENTRRVKTDEGSTAFFEAREFYAFKEFDIPAGESETVRVVANNDTVVQTFSVTLTLGELRVELVTGGAETGAFQNEVPIFNANMMDEAPNVSPNVTMQNGGEHSGGTIVDLLLANAGSPARQARTNSATEPLPIGFAPGTFYIRLVNSDNDSRAQGLLRVRWEDR